MNVELAPTRASLLTAVALALLSAACGGDSSTPTSASATGQSCRTYATSSRAVQTGEQGTQRGDLWQMTSSCRWSNDRLSCTRQYSQFTGDCQGQPGDSTWTAIYASAADFVDEVAASPPVSKVLSTVITSTAGSCPSPSDSRYQYDASGRLLRITSGAASLAGNAGTSFTSWDSRGRPTGGTFSNFRVNGPLTIRYDEAARTATRVGTYDGGGWVVTETTGYDVNGNVVREVFSDVVAGDPPRPVYTTTTTVLATDRVCK